MCVCVLQGHGEADRRLSPGVGGRGRSPLIMSNYPAWSLCFETIKCKAAHTFSPLSSFTMSASSASSSTLDPPGH